MALRIITLLPRFILPACVLTVILLRSVTGFAAPVSYSTQGTRNIPTLSFGSRHLFIDLDNDGDLDVLYQTGNTAGTGIAVQLNSGGTFGTAITATSGTGAFTSGPLNGISFTQIVTPNLCVVDLDNDGDADMVEFINSTAPRWIKNNGNGTFTTSTISSLATLSFGSRQLFADMDNDGDEDILYQTGNTSGTGIAVQLNNGNGTFATAITATSGTGAFTSGPLNGISFTQINNPNNRTVDIDDDGDDDMLEFVNSTAPRLLLNNGNGTFTGTSISSLPTLAFGSRQLFFDIDADGDQDILYQTGNTSGTGIAIQLNNGSGTFATAVTATSGTGAFTSGPLSGISFAQIVAGNTDIADYDTDNDPDIFDFTNSTAPVAIRQDGTRPLISSTAPVDNATGVSVSANIILTFDRSVVKGNGNLYLVSTATNTVVETVAIGNSAITGSGTTWTYNPIITLSGGTSYALRSDEETFIDADGRAFYGIFDTTTLNFTTATAPTITTGALSTSSYCAGAQLIVSFSSSALTPGAGNIYTAQLSNSSGAFTSATTVGTLSSTATSGNIGVTIPSGVATGSGYRVRVISSSPAVTGSDNGTNLTITAPTSDPNTYYLANTTTTQSATLSTNNAYAYMDASCHSIAAITPTGAAMGNTAAKVSLQSTAPTYNSAAYVRRFYDIAPATNASTATATITLYYTQADFNDYNSNNGTAPDLPTSSSDASGIANLRITQQHGTSATGTPGSYSGWTGTGPANVLIDPADANIVWNGSLSRWEVTFSATGFSGFFAHGGGSTPLPVHLVSFTARREGADNLLYWKTGVEGYGAAFAVQRSNDGRAFTNIGVVSGTGTNSGYQFTDRQPLSPTSYYRLHLMESGNDAGYSQVAVIHGTERNGQLSISPVPATKSVFITLPAFASQGQTALIADMLGRVVSRVALQQITELDIENWPAGVYLLRLSDGSVSKIVKE